MEKGSTDTKVKQRQFQIDRWRLDEYRALPSAQASSELDNKPNVVQDTLDPYFGTTWFPLPADHLIHLIEYNVFRGLQENKTLLEQLAIQYDTADKQTEAFHDHTVFPRYSVIVPLPPYSSTCLTPTPLQMSVIHSTWINFLPFPRMRDNLIRSEFAFDHADLVRDLVGDLINLKIFLSTSSSSRPAPASRRTITEGDDEKPTTSRTGLIVWGEPYRADSWEATPEFLQKWAWAVADCQELIDSTNHWRTIRGEKPLRLSVKVMPP